MKTLKTLLAAAVLASAGLLTPAQSALKIVVVDTSKLMSESIEGKKTSDALQKVVSDEEQKFKAMKDEYDAMVDDLKKKADTLSPESLAEQQEAIKSKAAKVDRAYQSTMQNLEIASKKAQYTYSEKLSAFLAAWGKRKGFSLVIEISALPYHDPSMNVTTEALKDLNEAYIAAGQPEPKIDYGAAARPAPKPAPKSGTPAPKKP